MFFNLHFWLSPLRSNKMDKLNELSETHQVRDNAYIPNPETGFKLANRCVKYLITEYLQLFQLDDLPNLTPKLGCTVFKIPNDYVKRARIVSEFRALPARFAKKDSLYYVPDDDETEPIEFKRMPIDTVKKLQALRKEIMEDINNAVPGAAAIEKLGEVPDNNIGYQRWNIHLHTVDLDSEPVPDITAELAPFDGDRAHIRKMIEGAYNGARGVFYHYRARFAMDLETLDLVIDHEKFCLSLRDSRFPKFEFPLKIYFSLELLR
jgi:hypothetical protein